MSEPADTLFFNVFVGFGAAVLGLFCGPADDRAAWAAGCVGVGGSVGGAVGGVLDGPDSSAADETCLAGLAQAASPSGTPTVSPTVNSAPITAGNDFVRIGTASRSGRATA
jgi:hypothetical protein